MPLRSLFLSLVLTVTHISAASWVPSANAENCDFTHENLPYGVFGPQTTPAHIGVAIGDPILDLHACVDTGLMSELSTELQKSLQADTLNPLMSLERKDWQALRCKIQELLAANTPTLRDNAGLQKQVMVAQSDAQMLMPVTVGDYTDFYSSINHATHVGSLFRPDNPLMPNYKHLPVVYHGRAS